MGRVAVAALLAFGLIIGAPAPAAPVPPEGKRVVRIGIVPFFTPEKMWQLYEPFVAYLNAHTPFAWELALGEKHDELVAKLAAGEIDVALLGPIPYGKALRGRVPIHPLLLALGTDGQPFYQSVLITADPAVASLPDLKGRRFGLFEQSTAAYYVPLAMLAEEGVARDQIVPVLLSSQDKIVSAVLGNQVAAGGVRESLFRKIRDPRLRLLKTSAPLPQFAFVAARNTPPEVAKAFTEALLPLAPLTRPADRETVKGWDPEVANGFTLPTAGYEEGINLLLLSVEPFLEGR
jgi:phosphonate transport system substrate-binding protein